MKNILILIAAFVISNQVAAADYKLDQNLRCDSEYIVNNLKQLESAFKEDLINDPERLKASFKKDILRRSNLDDVTLSQLLDAKTTWKIDFLSNMVGKFKDYPEYKDETVISFCQFKMSMKVEYEEFVLKMKYAAIAAEDDMVLYSTFWDNIIDYSRFILFINYLKTMGFKTIK